MPIIKNKKGTVTELMQGFLMIGLFGIISIMIITAVYFMFAIGHDYAILPMYNISQLNNFANSTDFQQAYEYQVTSYQDMDINNLVDDYWIFAYYLMIVISLYMAYKTRGMNFFSFINMLTFGLMFVLFIIGLIGTVISWWYQDILLKLFNNMAVNPIMFSWYVSHFSLAFLIQAAVMLLVSVVDLDFAFWKSRGQKESTTLDDEIV